MEFRSLAEKNPDRVKELTEGFQTSRLSIRDYMGQLKARFDTREPQVQAFLSEETDRFKRLRQEITNLESQFPEPDVRPPLYGIPFGVKDIFHVDGFPTRAGSQLPPEVLTGPEATSVSI